ncbi:luciferase domain-containing protein [Actinomadura litoris]|uniref:luciferase domain-containing protein n=1 Tax=Actinomadura litoris TaxID=2678616 RepID=UPI001FA6C144|nr:luciferase family protein [Actinomadura litoris]
MATGGSGTDSNAGRVVARLRKWSGVSVGRADCGLGVALCAGHGQFMHLHTGDEAELCLTRPVVDRLGGALADSGRVLVRPGGDWVAVRLDTDSDMAMAVSLASVAIKAHTRPAARGTPIAPCPAASPPRPGGSGASGEPSDGPSEGRGVESEPDHKGGHGPADSDGRADAPDGSGGEAERPGIRDAVPGRRSG